MSWRVIDVSQYQGVINWEKVQSQIDWAVIRTGTWLRKTDEQFVRNITECNRLGIPCGVYHFSYAENIDEARKEAERVLSMVEPYRLDLPIFYDFEDDSVRVAGIDGVTITKDLATEMAHTFLQTIEQAGYFASIYTGAYFSRTYYRMDEMARYDVWWALYYDGADPNDPPLTSKNYYPACGMWQYGLTTVDGIAGNVDGDVAFKDYPTLIKSNHLNNIDKWLTPSPVIPAPAPKEDLAAWAISNGLSVDGSDIESPITKREAWTIIKALKEVLEDG